MSLALLAVRALYTGTFVYRFLAWNLFLAWIPLFAALLASSLARYPRWSWPLVGLLSLVWLLFFPNAPYIVTDLMHLQPRQGVPLWYDLIMLLSFAWNGLIVGFASLRMMQTLVQQWMGDFSGWLFALGTLTLSGFGIYLGRFLRWNSWDLLTEPRGVAYDILSRVANPADHPGTVAVTVLYASFLVLAYVTLVLFGRTHQSRSG